MNRELRAKIQEMVEMALVEDGYSMRVILEEVQRAWITTGLETFGNNQCRFAERENMHRNTLSRLMKKIMLDPKTLVLRRRQPRKNFLTQYPS